MNKEQKIVIGIVIVSILVLALMITGDVSVFKKQDKILLNGFEITQKDYKAIKDLSEDKNYEAVSICNFDVQKCSVLLKLP